MIESGVGAQDDLTLLTEMRKLTGRVDTGAGASIKQFFGSKLGIKTEGIGDIEAYTALVNRLTPQQRLPGTGATSDFDAAMFKASIPGLTNTRGGNLLIMDTMEALANNKMARADLAAGAATGEMTMKEAVIKLRDLQGQARALSDRAKKHLADSGITPPEDTKDKATEPPTPEQEGEALKWIRENPTDPRVPAMKKKLGIP